MIPRNRRPGDRKGAAHEARNPDDPNDDASALPDGVRLSGGLRLAEPEPDGVHGHDLRPHGGRRRRGHRPADPPGGGGRRRWRGGHCRHSPRPGGAGGRRGGGGLPLSGRGGPEPPAGDPPAPAGAGAASLLPPAGRHRHGRRPAGAEHRGRHAGPSDLCGLWRPDGAGGPGPHLQEPGHPPGLLLRRGRRGHQRRRQRSGRPDPGPPECRLPGHHPHPGEPVRGLLRRGRRL